MTVLTRILLTLLLIPATALPAAAARADAYVDLVDFPEGEDNWDRFYALEDQLIRDFDYICGDTFCEGEYTNLIALQFRCSVHAASATMQQCVLVIGGGNLDVDTYSGELIADNRTWACTAPLGPATPVETFHAALEGRDALQVPLPGSGVSLHYGLIDCLY